MPCLGSSAVFLAGVMSLEAAIAQKTEGKPVTEVTELVLDQCKTSKVTGLSKFNNLKVLQLNDCGLTSLEDFPTLPSLQRLELADNNLSEGLDALQDAGLIQLRVLVLAGNKFAQVETLESLGGCPNLRELDMYGCPMTNKEDYRDAVFEMLPNLKYLDGLDPDGNEKPEDDEDEDDYGEDGEEDEDGDSLLEDSEQEGLGEDDDDDISVDVGASAGIGGDIGGSELGEEDGGEEVDDFGEDDGEEGESELGEDDGEEGESDLGEDGASESGDASVEDSAKRQRR